MGSSGGQKRIGKVDGTLCFGTLFGQLLTQRAGARRVHERSSVRYKGGAFE